MKSIWSVTLLLITAAGCSTAVPVSSVKLDAEAIRASVEKNILPLVGGATSPDRQFPSVAVGVVTPEGQYFFSYVSSNYPEMKRPQANTIFEIGSNSKVFTSLLLASEVVKGHIELESPIGDRLPDMSIPAFNGTKISFLHLSTHTSGLPRLSDNMDAPDPRNPYSNYDEKHLQQYLAEYVLQRSPGSRWEYSNTGAGLLGYALTRLTGEASYESLLKARVSTPLAMTDTGVTLSSEQLTRFAPGHLNGKPTPWWDLNVLVGAGGIRSTVQDMMKFLDAELMFGSEDLAPAMKLTQKVWRKAANPEDGQSMGLGWIVTDTPSGLLVWHNGATYGAQSFMAILPQKGIAIVLLTNGCFMSQGSGVDARTDQAGIALLTDLVKAQRPF